MFVRRVVAVPLIIILTASSLSAFLITKHIDVTKKGLDMVVSKLSTRVQGRPFTSDAIQEIESANLSRDLQDCSHTTPGEIDNIPAIPCDVFNGTNQTLDDNTLTGEMIAGLYVVEFAIPAEHFDDELFKEGNQK